MACIMNLGKMHPSPLTNQVSGGIGGIWRQNSRPLGQAGLPLFSTAAGGTAAVQNGPWSSSARRDLGHTASGGIAPDPPKYLISTSRSPATAPSRARMDRRCDSRNSTPALEEPAAWPDFGTYGPERLADMYRGSECLISIHRFIQAVGSFCFVPT
jgi:hypothetical protein